jgi:hypothetical protein
MKKIVLISAVLLSLVTISVSQVKEKGAVVQKFVDEQDRLHVVVKFADGTVQDNIVSRQEYTSTKELEFYSTTRR